MKGWQCLRKHGVEFNILCTVNAANQAHGRRVYRFFRDELGATWMQFIPIVERATADTIEIANLGWSERPQGEAAAVHADAARSSPSASVGGEQYGQFLVDIFEEWVRRDVGKVYVQLFDVTLEAYFGQLQALHPRADLRLRAGARVQRRPVRAATTSSSRASSWATSTRRTCSSWWPRRSSASSGWTSATRSRASASSARCGRCATAAVPRTGSRSSKDGEPGHNYLCEGLYRFFTHTRPAMRRMADVLQRGQAAGRSDGVVAARGHAARRLCPVPLRQRRASSVSATARARRRRSPPQRRAPS